MTAATIRRLGLLLFVAGLLCAPATAALAQAAAPPPPGIGVKLLQGPANSVNDPRAHQYIVDHLNPGTTISRQIGFSNGDARPVHLSFYATAADITGGVFKPGAGHTVNDLTSWTTFSPTSATLQPDQTIPVTVTIAVPADASPGERYAAALADNSQAPGGAGGETAVSRIGIRIYLSIGPGGAPKSAFTVDSMTAERNAKGDPVVMAKVHNTGGRAVDLSGQLELANGPSSLSAGPFPVDTITTLAPGESGPVSVVLDPRLPTGPWDARITLVSGLTTESATGRITFPATNGASAAPAVVAAAPLGKAGTSPLLLGAIALGVIALLILLVVLWRLRRPDEDDARPTPASADGQGLPDQKLVKVPTSTG